MRFINNKMSSKVNIREQSLLHKMSEDKVALKNYYQSCWDKKKFQKSKKMIKMLVI